MKYNELYKTILDELNKVFETFDYSQVEKLKDEIKKANKVFFIGVGREGMATRAFAMRVMHMGKETHWIWDDTTPNIDKGDLLIATSGDGCIGHIHYVVEKAKLAGANIFVVTGSPSGQTAKIADNVLFVPASVYRGTDKVVKSIQPMGNLFEQSLFILFDIIIMQIVNESDLTFEDMSNRHRNVE